MNIDKQQAKRLYKESTWLRPELVKEFGEGLFKEKNMTDIKTFADACKEMGHSEEEFNNSWSNMGLPEDTLAYEKLKIIAGAINDGWTPDWSNTNEAKWFPLFTDLSSGSGFSRSHSFIDFCVDTGAGSRLCYGTKEKSNYAATQFSEIYNKFLTISES